MYRCVFSCFYDNKQCGLNTSIKFVSDIFVTLNPLPNCQIMFMMKVGSQFNGLRCV